MEEWRQCGRWLIDCKVLPLNHRVVWPSAVVFDLAQALRDGVLLCQMLHNLSPGSVDLKQINFRPQMSQASPGWAPDRPDPDPDQDKALTEMVSVYQKWSNEGTVMNRRQGHGRPRLTDARGERRLARVIRSNRRATVAQISEVGRNVEIPLTLSQSAFIRLVAMAIRGNREAGCSPLSSSGSCDDDVVMQFLCLKNIRTFLKVCHDKFGLRNSELFDPFDLFDVRDFGKFTWKEGRKEERKEGRKENKGRKEGREEWEEWKEKSREGKEEWKEDRKDRRKEGNNGRKEERKGGRKGRKEEVKGWKEEDREEGQMEGRKEGTRKEGKNGRKKAREKWKEKRRKGIMKGRKKGQK
ncbi:hypothetical protein QTP86_002529 [Hemibagrus guttatus]|nr:hypothetical protein QTP86_002529 [Hemibagrus guttatus]